MKASAFLCGLACCMSVHAIDFNPNDHITGGKSGGVVGNVPMEIGVDNTGAATFSIPIDLPQGCGGLTPELSINYNSIGGNGMFGRGVDLAGVSAIYRTAATRYVNGYDRGVLFDSEDALCLDGQPILRNSDNPLKYHCRIGDIYDITADDADNPTRFTLRDGNGLTKEFGLSENSRLMGRKNNLSSESYVFAWLLERVTDSYGNYYTITYKNQTHALKGVAIDKIEYSGNINAGIEPQIEIRFGPYRAEAGDAVYHGDNAYLAAAIPESIMVLSNGERVRSYDFRYESSNNYVFTFLKSITAGGTDWQIKYNPIEFTWKNPTEGIKDPKSTNIPEIANANVYVGDYNGDGLSDILAVPNNNTSWKNFKYYLNDGNGGFILKKEFDVVLKGGIPYIPNKPNKLLETYVADFNGDGRDDIIFEAITVGEKRRLYLYLSDGNGFYDSGIVLDFTTENARLIGDFNGDGAADVLFTPIGRTTAHFIISQLSDNEIKPLALSFPVYLDEAWEEVQLGNFDGGHNTDIINLKEYGHTCYALNESTQTLIPIHRGAYPDRSETHYSGDFNGDGKTDFVITTNNRIVREAPIMCLCTGTQFVMQDMARFGSSVFNRDRKVLVADVNGDGKDDFVSIPNSNSVSRNSILTLLSSGNGTIYHQDMYISQNIHAADQCFYGLHDMYGEGKYTLFGLPHSEQKISGEYLIYNDRTPCDAVITEISDCLGNTTAFQYERLTDYTNSPFIEVWEDYPYSGCSMPLPLVKKMTQSNGRGDYLSTLYDYKDARTHLGKMSFLGFKNVVTSDQSSNQTMYDSYKLDPDFGMLSISNRTESKEGNLLETSNITYTSQTSKNGTSLVFPSNITSKRYSPISRSNYLTIEQQRTYDNWGNVLSERKITNDNTITTDKYTYYSVSDSTYLVGLLSLKESQTSVNGSNGIVTKEKYTHLGLVKPIIVLTSKGSNNIRKVRNMYDIFGNVCKKTDGGINTSKTHVINWEFSSDGRYCLKENDEMNYSKTFHYDKFGNNTRIEYSDGITDSIAYDSFGTPILKFITGTSKSHGTVWSNDLNLNPDYGVYCEYDKSGNNSPYLTFYDSKGNKLRECREINGKISLKDYEYNSIGNLISESLSYFVGDERKHTQYTYDEYGNMIGKVLPNGESHSMEYDYSIDGISTTITTASGTTSKLMDHFNRLKWSENEIGQRVEYTYNADGQCIQVDADSLITSFSYDYNNLGYKNTTTKNDEFGKTIKRYDELGNLYHITRSDFPYTGITYNKLGHATKKSTGKDYTFTYKYIDGKPNCIGEISSIPKNYKHEFSYDSYNRPIVEKYSLQNTTYTISCEYDTDGRVEFFTYPNGLKLQYDYSDDLLVAIKNATDGSYIWHATEFDANGKSVKCMYGDQISASYKYDITTGRMTDAQYDSIFSVSYTINNRGLIESRKENNSNKETYGYDNIGRLIGSNRELSHLYPYPSFPIDPDPFPRDSFILASNYSGIIIPPRDSIIIKPDYPNKPIYTVFEQHYSYDNHNNINANGGRTISKIVYADGATKILENALDSAAIKWNNIVLADINRISEIDNATDTLRLEYNENNERFSSSMSSPDGEISRHYISSIFEIININGESIPVCYIRNNTGLVAINVQNQIYYVLTDHQGSIMRIVDCEKNVVASYNYSDWGKRTIVSQKTEAHPWLKHFNRGYCGHEHLPEFELINMGARIYDPVDMRFLSPDPLVQDPTLPQNFNRYSYCLNNPINYTDPTGEFFFIDDFIVGFVTGLVEGGWKNAVSEGAKRMRNCGKILKGLTKTGYKNGFLNRSLELLSRFTWQLPQTLVGLEYAQFSNLVGKVDNVSYYGGTTAIASSWFPEDSGKAVTIGNYITGNPTLQADPINDHIFQHEYGHYIQSMLHGPMYLRTIGIPSLINTQGWIGCRHKYFYTEKDANNRAFKHFVETIPGFSYSNWDWGDNPTYEYHHNPSDPKFWSNLSVKEYHSRMNVNSRAASNIPSLFNALNIR